MSTKGITDIVFCIDASTSMRPCIDAVRHHVVDFIRGLESNPQLKMDWRIDFLAHGADEGGNLFPMQSHRHVNIDLMNALYRDSSGQSGLFTTSLEAFQGALEKVAVIGDEATLIALDTALDFPWRPRSRCHRVVVCLTDEAMETNAALDVQRARLPAVLDKIERLGVMLFLVAPASPGFDRLAEVDRSEYEVVDIAGDGLRSVAFNKVLAYIGKSLSVATLQSSAEAPVPRALFGQDTWVATHGSIRGR